MNRIFSSGTDFGNQTVSSIVHHINSVFKLFPPGQNLTNNLQNIPEHKINEKKKKKTHKNNNKIQKAEIDSLEKFIKCLDFNYIASTIIDLFSSNEGNRNTLLNNINNAVSGFFEVNHCGKSIDKSIFSKFSKNAFSHFESRIFIIFIEVQIIT